MIRLILLTDFTEAFPQYLLQGILRYAKEQAHEPWVVCRMPLSFKEKCGLEGVVDWALKWGANAIIGCFNSNENVTLFAKNGIVAVAQDSYRRFSSIPNLTSDYIKTGRMAADFFLEKGFKNFAFCGYHDTVWSDERCEGFRQRVEIAGYADHFQSYTQMQLDTPWFYDSEPLSVWLKSLPLHTALFCCDDCQGNVVTEVCNYSGIRIPESIAVLGVDNDNTICNLSQPTLSSINLDTERGGYEVAALITKMMAEPKAQYDDVVIQPTTMVSRTSTNVYATDDPYLLKALEYIHAHLDNPLSVGDILKQLPLSRRLLEQRFRAVTGSSIYSYISHCRMEKFASLLEDSDSPISEIAIQMGVNNYGNLTRQFKAIKGCTPTEYRMKHKGK
jgi:LacI family transcriptional regulator